MRKSLAIPIILLLTLQSHAQNLQQLILDEAFLIERFEHAEVLKLNETTKIKTFQDSFWKKDSTIANFRFIIPFDFEDGQIDETSHYGIPVEGLPTGCLIYDCKMYWVKVFLHSKKAFELNFDEGGLETSIEKNVLNYGYLPYYSETPELAYTEIRISRKLKIEKTEYILFRVAEAYINLIQKRITAENLEINEALEKYPLKIMLTELTTPPKLKKKDLNEINEVIELDFEN